MRPLVVIVGIVGLASLACAGPTPRLKLKQTSDANANDNFRKLDDAAMQTGLTTFTGQMRILAQGPPAAGNPTGIGGIDIDSTNIGNGVGVIVENDRVTPVAYDANYPFWISADADVVQPSMGLESHSNTTGVDGVFAFRRSRGAHTTPLACQSGNILGTLLWQAYDGQGASTGWQFGSNGGVASVEPVASENFDATHHGTQLKLYATPQGGSSLVNWIGSTAAGNAMVPGSLKVGAATEPAVALDVTGNFAVTGGVSSSTGIQHARFASPLGGTCPTGSSIGNTCTSANLNWPVSFGNTSYTVTCSITAATNVPEITTITKAADHINVVIAAGSAAAANAGVDCIAFHD